ncbi:hypothetical protein AVEN_14795-1 [Araneus ventricosus]|uniref:Uncharacterized protein n=1 Tax=Araneus ventricosus TaxID=182803 RepID=A0A4Y2FHZ5_ARAVE|nr:hypothetical protein AVEN_14795-1 [Araneus ventricosus]
MQNFAVEGKEGEMRFYDFDWEGNLTFTDVSKIDDKVGLAFVHFVDGVEFGNKQFRLSDGATVFMADVIAIKEAIEYTHERNLRNVKNILDSRSALMSLNSPLEKRQILSHIKESIDDNIELRWVRAHQNQLDN